MLLVNEGHIGSDCSSDGRQQVKSLFQRNIKSVGTEVCCLSNSSLSHVGDVSLFTMSKKNLRAGRKKRFSSLVLITLISSAWRTVSMKRKYFVLSFDQLRRLTQIAASSSALFPLLFHMSYLIYNSMKCLFSCLFFFSTNSLNKYIERETNLK